MIARFAATARWWVLYLVLTGFVGGLGTLASQLRMGGRAWAYSLPMSAVLGALLTWTLVRQRRLDRADSGAAPEVAGAARQALDEGTLPADPEVREAVRLMLPRARRQSAVLRRWLVGAAALIGVGIAVTGVLGVVVGREPAMAVLVPVAVVPALTTHVRLAAIERRHDALGKELERPPAP